MCKGNLELLNSKREGIFSWLSKTKHWCARIVEKILFSAQVNRNFMQKKVSKMNLYAAVTAAIQDAAIVMAAMAGKESRVRCTL